LIRSKERDRFLQDATSYATIIPYVGQTIVMGNEIYNSTTMQVLQEENQTIETFDPLSFPSHYLIHPQWFATRDSDRPGRTAMRENPTRRLKKKRYVNVFSTDLRLWLQRDLCWEHTQAYVRHREVYRQLWS